jgi:hypothetical protein
MHYADTAVIDTTDNDLMMAISDGLPEELADESDNTMEPSGTFNNIDFESPETYKVKCRSSHCGNTF